METPNLFIFNSLSNKKEQFIPFDPNLVSMYTCGITVYHDTHIGHIKKYIGDDLIRRSLEFLGYKVKHVQNVTDVGHLTSDSDEGEDKMEKGARLKNMDVWTLAKTLTDEFYKQMELVNVLKPTVIEGAASEKAIKEQLEIIKKLVESDFAYVAENAVYFDVSKLPTYNPFSNQSLTEKVQGVREDVIVDSGKKNAADFALWVFTKGIHQNHVMKWDSPWGVGFPGWHIECSAISISNLGEFIDIHTGGIDHKEIHHPNEIAQNFAYFGHDVVKYWVHHNFLQVDSKKMSKSLGNYYVLKDILDKGYSPMVVRYFMLQAHYRSEINFTFKALDSAKAAYIKLVDKTAELLKTTNGVKDISEDMYYKLFVQSISDDFNIPKALAVLWDVLNDQNISTVDQVSLVLIFDEVFGLKLKEEGEKQIANSKEQIAIPDEVVQLAKQRWEAKQNKEYAKADEIRKNINDLEYSVVDEEKGYRIIRK